MATFVRTALRALAATLAVVLVAGTCEVSHEVRSGETLDSIVRGRPDLIDCGICWLPEGCLCPTEAQISVQVAQVAAWNNLGDTDNVVAGAVLCLTGPGAGNQDDGGGDLDIPASFDAMTRSEYLRFRCQMNELLDGVGGCRVSGGCEQYYPSIVDAMGAGGMDGRLNRAAAFLATVMYQSVALSDFSDLAGRAGAFMLDGLGQYNFCLSNGDFQAALRRDLAANNSTCVDSTTVCLCGASTQEMQGLVASPDFAFKSAIWFLEGGSLLPQCGGLMGHADIGLGQPATTFDWGTGFNLVSSCVHGSTSGLAMEVRTEYYSDALVALQSDYCKSLEDDDDSGSSSGVQWMLVLVPALGAVGVALFALAVVLLAARSSRKRARPYFNDKPSAHAPASKPRPKVTQSGIVVPPPGKRTRARPHISNHPNEVPQQSRAPLPAAAPPRPTTPAASVASFSSYPDSSLPPFAPQHPLAPHAMYPRLAPSYASSVAGTHGRTHHPPFPGAHGGLAGHPPRPMV